MNSKNKDVMKKATEKGYIRLLKWAGIIFSVFFIFMIFLAMMACLQNSNQNQKNMGYILIASIILLSGAVILMGFKKRLLAMLLSVVGWVSTLFVGIRLSSSFYVAALQELPNDKFIICHILPVVIPIYCIGFFIYYKIKQKREDENFFLRRQKQAEEKYKSILKD